MWLALGIFSALFIGVYDVCKKHAVRDNAVIPVLWLSTVFGLAILVPLKAVSIINPELAQGWGLYIEPLSITQHFAILAKSVLVSVAWLFAFAAIKNLPISIVTPIRASGPMWTLFGAMIMLHERFTAWQWVGIMIVFASYYYFSLVGRREGILFERNKWIYFIVAATLLGTCSALYDKVLLREIGLSMMAMMFWFSAYLVVVLGVVTAVCWYPKRSGSAGFRFRYSIALVGILLVLADFLYFKGLTNPDALLALLAIVRRSSVIVSFVVGAILFSEINKRRKAAALAGVLLGVFIIMLSTY